MDIPERSHKRLCFTNGMRHKKTKKSTPDTPEMTIQRIENISTTAKRVTRVIITEKKLQNIKHNFPLHQTLLCYRYHD